MEPKFQSSFIPRKSAVDTTLRSHATVGIFTLVCVAAFIVAAGLAAGLFVWQQVLTEQNASRKEQLDAYNRQLNDPNIQELVNLSDRIKTANSHLATHVAVSAIFDLFSVNTLENVQWNSFTFSTNEQTGPTVNVSGVAKALQDVALQSDRIFANPLFVNPAFSDVSMNDNGTVAFSMKTSIDPKVVSYKQKIGANEVVMPASSATTVATSSVTGVSTTTEQ